MSVFRRKPGILFFPLSVVYGLIVWLRNRFFNMGFIRQESFDIPVISIGNITAGGTGKTPHTEYLLDLLTSDFKVAVLSRGYKRKSRGFILARPTSTVADIGDEPRQMALKFPDAIIAVNNNRANGIYRLINEFGDLNVVLLDDAFQHRRVKPGLSVVLIDYNRPVHSDALLPYGNLREQASELKRAHIVIVTKTPEDIKPIEKRIFIKELGLYPFQFLYFTTFRYGAPVPIFKKSHKGPKWEHIHKNTPEVLLVTGIANAKPLLVHIQRHTNHCVHMEFADHHFFTENDLVKIHERFKVLGENEKYIFTTEKDAMRIKEIKHIDKTLKDHLFFIPVEVKFLDDKAKNFNKDIVDYVAKEKSVNRLFK